VEEEGEKEKEEKKEEVEEKEKEEKKKEGIKAQFWNTKLRFLFLYSYRLFIRCTRTQVINKVRLSQSGLLEKTIPKFYLKYLYVVCCSLCVISGPNP